MEALRAQATPEATARFGLPETIVAQARHHAVEAAPRYFEFAQAWPRLMETVGRDAELRDRLLVRFGQAA